MARSSSVSSVRTGLKHGKLEDWRSELAASILIESYLNALTSLGWSVQFLFLFYQIMRQENAPNDAVLLYPQR